MTIPIMDNHDTRLDDLEMKLSFTEDLVEELNRTVFHHQQQIELLANELRALRDQVQQGPTSEFRSLRDEIPPHY